MPSSSVMLAGASSQLPVAATPFLGRERERAAVLAYLHDPACRLITITITGIGGVGKTRLGAEAAALATAGAATTPFTDGVVFVPLASLVPGNALNEQVATTIATVIGLRIAGPDAASVQVGHFLRTKALLLVLDNFEHVLGSIELLMHLLAQALAVKLLVTSRERLRLRGERVVWASNRRQNSPRNKPGRAPSVQRACGRHHVGAELPRRHLLVSG